MAVGEVRLFCPLFAMRAEERQQNAGVLHLVKRQGLKQAVVQLKTHHNFVVKSCFSLAEFYV